MALNFNLNVPIAGVCMFDALKLKRINMEDGYLSVNAP